jgi:ParB family chromosome partitioning protein
LNAIEEAEGYQALIARFGHTQDNISKLVGKSRSHVSNLLRLLDFQKQCANAAARRYQHGPCSGCGDGV